MKISKFINQPFLSADLAAEFSDETFVQSMLDFELAIIEIKEHHSLIPLGILEKTKQALLLSNFDLDDMAQTTYLGGNPAIPFVAQAKRLLPDEIKPYFHQTVTSQDVVDSAMMLMIKSGLETINQDLIAILEACGRLIKTHSATPMSGRTLLQQALPITFGVKVSQWSSALVSVVPHLVKLQKSGLYLQWGGPVGVSNVENEQHQLPQKVAALLGLTEPLLPWHTNRQPIHSIGSTLDALAGAFENIVEDISLMCQSEIGELAEPPIEGMGGSSSMAHKRNPVLCALIKTAAIRMHGHLSVISNTTAQPFERGLGEWHASWMPLIEGLALVAGASSYMKVLLEGLRVYPERMAENLDLTSDAYLINPLTQYLSNDLQLSNKPQLLLAVNQASDQAHRDHIGFVRMLNELISVRKLKIDLTAKDIKILLSPLTYCGAAQWQCEKTGKALVESINMLRS